MVRSALLAAGVVLGAGCGTLLDGPPANQCASDPDCASGTCDVGRGMCVGTPAEALRVGIDIVPASDPFGGTPLPVSFAPREVAGPSDVGDLELPLGIPVRGMLEHVGEPVSASVTFTLLSEIPGGPPVRIETQTLTEPQRDEEGVAFNYALQVLPLRTYEVTIQPSGEWRSRLPPIRTRYMARERGTYEPSPYEDTLDTVHGLVLDPAGAHQSGMIVRAVEPVTGRVVSSTYTTGTDPDQPTGYFELTLSPGTESWVFTINASGARIEEGRPSPTFSVDPNALIDGPEGVTILVPAVSTQVITYRGFVEVADRPGQGTPAALTFTARDVLDEETQVLGSFRAMVGTSDEPGLEGEFIAQLLPGTYDVVVTPTSNDHGVVRETVMLAESEAGEVSGQVFAVPLRTRYPGTVQTLDAEPMFNAQVRGQARGSTSYAGMALPDAAVYARSSDAVTDAMGLFALPLDIGLYDVTVEPPSGTNWPWAIVRDVPIGTADARLGTRVIELSLPVPLTGRAIFAGGVPVASGEVRAYAIVEDGSSTRAIQVGRAQTDAEGRFTVLLPPSL